LAAKGLTRRKQCRKLGLSKCAIKRDGNILLVNSAILAALGITPEAAAQSLHEPAATAESAATKAAEPQAEEPQTVTAPASLPPQEKLPAIPNISGLTELTISRDTLQKLVAWGQGGVILLQARQFIDTLQGADRDLAYLFLGCEACDSD
jgi:hypothetical protein